MSRAGRWAVDAVIVLGLAVLVLLIARQPSSPEPATLPAETFTHVDVVVEDRGVHVSPASVPAGHVEFTVSDKRSNGTRPVLVRSVPPAIGIQPGSQLIALRVLRGYSLTAFVGDEMLPVAADLTVTTPQLAPPAEPEHRVRVDVHDGAITTPAREMRRGQPLLVSTDFEPPAAQSWTTVAVGSTDLVVRNRSAEQQSCRVGAAKAVVDTGDTATLQVELGGDTGFATITCTSAQGAQSFGFWFS